MILGTWTTIELVKALEMGYQVVKIYKIYHWENTSKYNPNTGSSGLFSGYVNQFLKIKQLASGCLEWCQEDETSPIPHQLQRKRRGCARGSFSGENSGLRSLAKLCLNR